MFETALEFVLSFEGGFSNDPDDRGRATNHGITIGTLEMWRGEPLTSEDIRNLSLDEAKAIYRVKYWEACQCDKMPDAIGLIVFDGGVNMGNDRSIQFLQKAIGVNVDGRIGPITLRTVKNADVLKTIDEIVALRSVHYAKLNSKFHLGWFRRLSSVHRKAIELYLNS